MPQERFVGQGLKERDEIGALVLRQRKPANRAALVRVVSADADVRSPAGTPISTRRRTTGLDPNQMAFRGAAMKLVKKKTQKKVQKVPF
jgi:hypothetical protein